MRPQRDPDAEVEFELTSRMATGEIKRVLSGYRPIYDVRLDYWTSVHHEFIDADSVSTGEKTLAQVWFISPEAYPRCLWVGRTLNVAEGARRVGVATISKVFNVDLLQPTI